MRPITADALAKVQAGYVLIADVLGAEAPELYVADNRQGYGGMLCELVSRPEVLQVHSHRLAPAKLFGKATPTPIKAEDFGTMAGYLWSGDEFALDGRGEEDEP